MKLKVKDGKVRFIMATGDDFVRNEMGMNAANEIIEKGTVTESTKFEGYPICVDEKFYFAATVTKRKSKRMKSSEVEQHPIAVTKSGFKEVQND